MNDDGRILVSTTERSKGMEIGVDGYIRQALTRYWLVRLFDG